MIEDFSLRPDANVMTRESFPAGTRFHIPSGGTEGGKDGVIVTFGLDTDHEWTGVFAFGLNGAFELNGHLTTKAVIPLANSDRVLVVADGDGFVVRE